MWIPTFDAPIFGQPWDKIVASAMPWLIDIANKTESLVSKISKMANEFGRLEEEFETIGRSPPVHAYESLFVRQGRGRIEARFLAYALVKLGAEHLAEELAARKLASAVGKLVRNEAANPFVVSRLAVALRHALNEPAAKSRLGAACYSAGVQEVFYSLNEIVDQAVNRDGKACRSLVDICKALRPHLPDPRGRRPDLAGATHELLLHIQNRAYTYHAYSEDMTDGATRATRAAMNNQDFDPRPAWRRLKKTRRSQSAEGHRIPAPGFAR